MFVVLNYEHNMYKSNNKLQILKCSSTLYERTFIVKFYRKESLYMSDNPMFYYYCNKQPTYKAPLMNGLESFPAVLSCFR